jgi:hypothetical protein
MPRESAHTKARRYITEGRLTITRVTDDGVDAHCRGDGEIHELGLDAGNNWHCTCPARTRDCAHLLALRLVTLRTATTR